MLIGSREHDEMMVEFEKSAHGRIDREHKDMWRRGNFYQNGEVNDAFIQFQRGVAYGRCVFINS